VDRLHEFLGSEARARLLTHFVVHPDGRDHVRALERHTDLGKRSLQVELERLQAMGLVEREVDGRRVVYRRDDANHQWRAIESLVAEYAPGLVLRDALHDVSGIDAAFVFGSVARGDARPDSDIDLLVLGDHIDDAELGAALMQTALVLDRPLDVKRYDAKRFVRDRLAGASFLPAALAGPIHFLVGSPDALPRSYAGGGE
jgi:predicted nucleotidyltransferase